MGLADKSFEKIVLRTTLWAEMQAREILEKGCTERATKPGVRVCLG
jgi:hypothetical protein